MGSLVESCGRHLNENKQNPMCLMPCLQGAIKCCFLPSHLGIAKGKLSLCSRFVVSWWCSRLKTLEQVQIFSATYIITPKGVSINRMAINRNKEYRCYEKCFLGFIVLKRINALQRRVMIWVREFIGELVHQENLVLMASGGDSHPFSSRGGFLFL